MALSLAVAAAACLAALALWRSLRGWHGTTLVAPIGWAMAVCGAAAIAELASWNGAASSGSPTAARYLVATLALTPGIAHLGAKRPQDRAWQLVVGTLLIVLWLPVLQGWLLGSGRLHIHFLLLWGLVAPAAAIAVVNMLPTRHAACALLAGLGQAGVWWNFFLRDGNWHKTIAHQTGLLLLAAAAILWALTSANRRAVPVRPVEDCESGEAAKAAAGVAALNAVWRDFCDAYGAVWGLRIVQRFNATAEQQGWSVRLTWFGLHHQPDAPPALMELDAVAQNLRALWRRFVSEEWLDGQPRMG